MVDEQKVRREHARWILVLALNNARPYFIFEEVLMATVQAFYPDSTQLELRRKLEYLEGRKLVELDRRPDGRWRAKLTRHGIDLAEYTIDCEPGIARPEKYW